MRHPEDYSNTNISALSIDLFRQINYSRGIVWNGETHWTVADRVLEFIGEFGELCNELKKLKRTADGMKGGFITDFDRYKLVERIQKEFADAYICLDLLAIELQKEVKEKLEYEMPLNPLHVGAEKFNETSEKYGFPHRMPDAGFYNHITRVPKNEEPELKQDSKDDMPF